MVPEIMVIYKLMRKIAAPWATWPAFERGIIDRSGRVLRRRASLRTQADRDAWTIGDVFAANLKKLLAGRAGLLGAGATVALMLREDELHDSLEGLLEEVPTNSSSSGQVAAIEEPSITAKGRRVRIGKILRRKPVKEEA
jgi:hypothetical protein